MSNCEKNNNLSIHHLSVYPSIIFLSPSPYLDTGKLSFHETPLPV